MAHVAMEGRPGPVRDALHQTVLEWIAVQVVEMAAQIRFIADEMFPESVLPETALAFGDSPLSQQLGAAVRWAGHGNVTLDPPPALGEVGIALRQSPDRMHMVR